MKKMIFSKIKSIVAICVLIATLLPILASCKIFDRVEIVDKIDEVPAGTMQITMSLDSTGAACASPYIMWTAEEGAEDYIIHIATDEGFDSLVESEVVYGTRYSVATVLNHATKYYVRILARKTIDNEKTVFAVSKTSFVTTAVHDTTAPDYSQTRTLFDFENYTTESFGDLFQPHAGGDAITAVIADGAGVDGSKALKIASEKGSMGWSAIVCSLLPTDKKVWVGTTGIRLYIRAEEGTSATFSVKVGKRGYQTWSKSFVVKNEEGAYITIPYEAMADQGGGDGIWDLSVMTYMQFTFSGNSGTVYIDDITIGSTEEYQYDTTAEASKGLAPGILEAFEGDGIGEKLNEHITLTNVDPSFTELVESTDGSGHEMRFKLMSQVGYVQLNKAIYNLGQYDYNQADGITFKISISHVKDGANILLKFGSYLNVYTATYSLEGATPGEYITVKIPFSELTLAEGSSGALNFEKVDTLQMLIKESQYCYVTLDDVGFYKD